MRPVGRGEVDVGQDVLDGGIVAFHLGPLLVLGDGTSTSAW